MVRKLSESEAAKVSFLRSRRGNYNWDEWTTGDTFVLTQGEDFHCSVATFRVQWCKYCKKAGMSGQTQLGTNKEGQVVLTIRAVAEPLKSQAVKAPAKAKKVAAKETKQPKKRSKVATAS